MKRLALVIFFLEVGFVLAVAPWSAYWDRNYFAETLPLIHGIITNNFVRGAVTGLGLLNVAAAIADLLGMFVARAPAAADVAVTESPVDK
jgi:hypothetical protein